MNTSEVLNKAADLIEERGWTVGEGWGLYGSPSNLCLEGGIIAALGRQAADVFGTRESESEFLTCPAYLAVVDYLHDDNYWQRMSERFGFNRLYNWNDAEHRTASEVIEVLRACALIEAAREAQETAWATYAELVAS